MEKDRYRGEKTSEIGLTYHRVSYFAHRIGKRTNTNRYPTSETDKNPKKEKRLIFDNVRCRIQKRPRCGNSNLFLYTILFFFFHAIGRIEGIRKSN